MENEYVARSRAEKSIPFNVGAGVRHPVFAIISPRY